MLTKYLIFLDMKMLFAVKNHFVKLSFLQYFIYFFYNNSHLVNDINSTSESCLISTSK